MPYVVGIQNRITGTRVYIRKVVRVEQDRYNFTLFHHRVDPIITRGPYSRLAFRVVSIESQRFES